MHFRPGLIILSSLGLVGALASACGSTAPKEVNSDNNTTIVNGCGEGQVECDGRVLQKCEGEAWVTLETCDSETSCLNGRALDEPACGSSDCTPGDLICNGNLLSECQPDHMSYLRVETCASPEACEAGLEDGECGVAGQGGEGNQSEPDPEFPSATIPETWFNAPFDYSFSAEGKGELTFELEAGTLPTGLTLSSSGRLSGTPTEAGAFNLSVKVTDENGSTTRAFELVVNRKRWLAYVSSVDGLLRVVEYTKPALPQIVVSDKDSMEAFSDIDLTYGQKPSFSPDGNWLVYAADKEVSGEYNLYLIDLRGDDPKPEVRITSAGELRSFDWSPDSQHLAFSEWSGSNYEMGYVVLDDDPSPENITSSGIDPQWIGDDILAYHHSGAFYYRNLDGGVFGAEREIKNIPTNSEITVAHHSQQRAVFQALYGGPCGNQSAMVHMDTTETFAGPATTRAFYSPDLQWVSDWGDDHWGIHPADNYVLETPTYQMSASNCGGAWSANSRFFVTWDTSLSVLDVTTGKSSSPSNVSGLYTPTFTSTTDDPYGGFTSDGRWLLVTGTDESLWDTIYAVPVGPNGAGDGVVLHSGISPLRIYFTPNAKYTIFYDSPSKAFKVWDLADDTPKLFKSVNTPGHGTSTVANGGVFTSADSSYMAFIATTTDAGPSDLYVAEIDSETAGRNVTEFAGGGGISFVLFQP